MNPPENLSLTCHLCGQAHRAVTLRPGETARCERCSSVMARGRRLGPEAPLVFAVTGLILAFPACLLPFMGAGKLGDQRTSLLFTGVGALWDQGMRAMAMLVLFCGGVVPFALLATLALFVAPARVRGLLVSESDLARLAGLLERWAIPEVQMLAVLVALMKLGSLVHITIGAGFWCYCAMSIALLMAVRGLDMDSLRKRRQRPGSHEPMSLRLPSLKSRGNTNAAALGLAAAIMLVPANLLPILETDTSGSSTGSTRSSRAWSSFGITALERSPPSSSLPAS